MLEGQLQVTITSPDRVLFTGRAGSVTLPGEQGTFEVLPLHRPLISRLISGVVIIDGRSLAIHRGLVHVADDTVTAIVEARGPATP